MSVLSEFILGCRTDQIRENVIIAPCWYPESVGIVSFSLVSESPCTIWDCEINGKQVSYILAGVGACKCADLIMALQETRAERLLFLGSAGALDSSVSIGDFIVPESMICAEGASRFLQKNISDDTFGMRIPVSQSVYEKLSALCRISAGERGVRCMEGVGVSVESIYSQYEHMEEIKSLGCNCIDMEASTFLYAAQKIGLDAAICFCISDNEETGEPLMSVDPQKTDFRKRIRKLVLPDVLKEFFA